MFVDRVTINVKGGDGGNGCLAFRREKYVPRGGPSGGDGGSGGSIILRAVQGVTNLAHLSSQRHWKAERGDHGQGSDCTGGNADDLVIEHPSDGVTTAVALTILGGPALYLAGNGWFQWALWDELPRSRIVGLVALAAVIPLAALDGHPGRAQSRIFDPGPDQHRLAAACRRAHQHDGAGTGETLQQPLARDKAAALRVMDRVRHRKLSRPIQSRRPRRVNARRPTP